MTEFLEGNFGVGWLVLAREQHCALMPKPNRGIIGGAVYDALSAKRLACMTP